MSFKFFLRIVCTCAAIFVVSCQPEPKAEESEQKQEESALGPEINFQSVSVGSITTDGASFSASVSIKNIPTNVIAYFYYGESATSLGKSGSIKSKEAILKSTGGDFSQAVTGLKKATTYFYVAAVTANGIETLSDIQSFDTKNTPSEVYTADYSNVTTNSATLSGTVKITGDEASAKYGIQYSKSSDKNFANGQSVYANAHDSAGGFSVAIDNLTENTSYIYRAFILQDGKYTYGESKSFKTLESSKVYTIAASDIDIRTAVVKVEYKNKSAASNITVGVCISKTLTTKDDLYNQGDKTETQTTYTEGTYTVTYKKLDGQCKYYYVGYAIIGSDVIFGEVKNFQTKNLVDHIIEYTSTTGATVDLHGELGDGVLLASNTYTSGVGKAVMNNPIEYMYGTFYKESTLKTAIIPKRAAWIERTFQECTSLESVSIPESVTAIGEFTFYKCTSLTEITLPSALTKILMYAFCDCSSLKTITIPATVTSMGMDIFGNCESLESIYILAKTPPELSVELYYGSLKPTIYVPAESVEDYKNAEIWSKYKEQITAL